MNKLTADQIANMSDEEAMNLDMNDVAFNSSAATADTAETDEDDAPTTVDEDQPDADDVDTTKETAATTDESEETDEDFANAKKEDPTNGVEAGKGDDGKTDKADAASAAAKTDADAGKKDAADAAADKQPAGVAVVPLDDAGLKDFHAKITGKFKANGREMQVQSPEEAIQLMQMGANYTKKMAALRPNLALMRMLENAGLLDEAKLSYLIDLDKKNPDAINKLVKDSGIDPLELSADKANDYRPGNYQVSEKALELDEVWASLEGVDGFDRTASVVGTMDKKSQAYIAEAPKVLEVLTNHMALGVYDVVVAEVERERTFNRLSGLSDLEAYRQVADAMHASGKFEHLLGKANPTSQQTAPAKVIADSKPKQADDSNRREKRKAASPVRAAAPSGKVPADFNPLTMSDEELMKLDISKFR